MLIGGLVTHQLISSSVVGVRSLIDIDIHIHTYIVYSRFKMHESKLQKTS